MSSVSTKPWQPVLEGKLAEQAWESIGAITLALREAEVLGGTLGIGASGLTLFFHALDAAKPNRGYGDDAVRFMEQATDPDMAPSRFVLYGGALGVAWATDRVAGPWTGEDDPYDEIDDALPSHLAAWNKEEFDLVSGVTGVGVYTLGRLPRPRAIRNLETIAQKLSELATRDSDGAAWFTSAERAEALARGVGRTLHRTGGYFNLGLAHGAPGSIAFLGKACASGYAPPLAFELLDEATGWLLTKADASIGYGAWLYPGERLLPCRSAWCYGNPGVALSLLIAGRGAGRRDWEKAGIDLLERETTRPREECAVVDAGLCHGSIGLAHVYNRAYQATRIERFADAARGWAEYAFSHRAGEASVAGYPAWGPDPTTRKHGWVNDPSLLTGIAGVGLGLLAMVTAEEPIWDGFLLIDIPASKIEK